jgi:uncharacterized protein
MTWQYSLDNHTVLPRQVNRLSDVDLDQLRSRNIYGIILDLDNTIISEDDRYLSPGAEAWIKTAQRSGFQLFILSNGKRRDRLTVWSKRLGVTAIGNAHKPFPKSFRTAIAYMRLRPFQVIVIGDSRHTDMLGAFLVGCSRTQVATLPHPFRWWEKLLGKRVQIPYPRDLELWDCPKSR